MRILHIIDHLGLGGAQTVIKGIFERQRKNRNIFLFVLRKREINIKIKHPNIKIFNSKEKYSLKPIKELKELIEREKIDVLHCHLFRSQFIGWRLKRKYFSKMQLIFHEHGQIFQNGRIYPYFMRKSREDVDLFIAVSKATKNKLIERAKISLAKIKVLYNFVDLDKFNPKKIKISIQKEKENLGIKKGDFVIGFVGRLSEVKGCGYLIKSLPYLNFNYKVLIAGDGDLRESLENLAKKLNVFHKIIFLGYIKETKKIYQLLDVNVIPSLNESFSLSAIESQAMKVPTIASNIDGLNEVVIDKKTGLLFEQKNERDLEKKIKLLHSNKKLKEKLINEGLKNAKAHSLKDYIKNLKEVYNNFK